MSPNTLQIDSFYVDTGRMRTRRSAPAGPCADTKRHAQNTAWVKKDVLPANAARKRKSTDGRVRSGIGDRPSVSAMATGLPAVDGGREGHARKPVRATAIHPRRLCRSHRQAPGLSGARGQSGFPAWQKSTKGQKERRFPRAKSRKVQKNRFLLLYAPPDRTYTESTLKG